MNEWTKISVYSGGSKVNEVLNISRLVYKITSKYKRFIDRILWEKDDDVDDEWHALSLPGSRNLFFPIIKDEIDNESGWLSESLKFFENLNTNFVLMIILLFDYIVFL